MANVVATFTANIAPFQSAMGSLATSVKAGTDAASNAGQRVGGAMASIGKASTIAGVAVGAMAAGAIKSYGTFQESINKAAVIAGSSNKSLKGDMKDLETEALSLGKTLPISAEDAGNAMIEMARNGASIKDLKTEFPAIAKASAVAGADLAGTATTVQQAMNIWGGGAKNAAKDSAILALNANMSNAEVEDMGQAFANVGSTAATLGIGIKDTSTAIGLMSNAGLGAAQGSQDLAHALTLMARPSKVAAGEMKELGITYTDAQGKFKPFPQILKEVAKATDGMSQSQKIAALTNLYGAAGAKAMLPLLIQTEKKTKSGKSGWDAYSDALGKVGGSAKAANKYLNDNSSNMTKNVGQSLAQMGDAFDAVVKTSIGTIAPQIQSVANALGNFATWLNKSKSPMASFVKGLIAWSPVIAGVLIVFGLLSIGIGKLVTAISAPVKAIRALTGATSKLPKPMSASAGQIAAMGAKAAGAGLGIGLAAAGFAALAFGVAALAKTGTDGLVALAAMTAAIVVILGVLALVAPTLTANAAGLLALGAGVLMATSGIALLVTALTNFQQAGGNATTLVLAIGVAVGGLALIFAVVAPALTAGAVGMIAFGAAVLLVGAGIALATTGLALLATQLPTIATYGTSAAVGILALGGALIVFGAGALVAGAGALVLGAGLSVAAAAILLASAATVALAAGVALLGAGIAVAGAASLLLGAGLALVATSGTAAGAALLGAAAAGTADAVANAAGAVAALAYGAGLVVLAAGATLAGAALVVLGAGGVVGGAGLTVLAAGIALVGGAIKVLAGGLRSLGSVVSSIFHGIVSVISGSMNSAKGAVSGGISGIKGIFSGAGGILIGAGRAIMNGLLGGLRSMWGAVQHFVGGIASWIKAHKGPISYDAKLLVPAGNAIMGGLNQGLQKSFGAVQKTVSGMASDISANMSANIGNLSMAGTQFSSGDVTQSIDASERITPNIYVQNNVDKNGINSMVKEADANDAAVSSYFRPIGG
ncbi:phage tail tape measure protein [Lacticaseibacillus rhamnosus]|uniref:phage tail tape measure protein n=1 Tax=Lacticaseibacillus rhamnosus TaxID=47715 RepID=UPI00195010A2|nr:phage tail tape measure protein [Lacticaseibacillus rhamnosus]MBM6408668.1 phage tail tape measure protein [Lacticaseibacillus rhamnosus]